MKNDAKGGGLKVGKEKKILLDSSSLILLHSGGLLPALCQSYTVSLAGQVFEEITVKNKNGADFFHDHAARHLLHVLQCFPDISVDGMTGAKLKKMGDGERYTLLHALAGDGEFVVVDDRLAIQFLR